MVRVADTERSTVAEVVPEVRFVMFADAISKPVVAGNVTTPDALIDIAVTAADPVLKIRSPSVLPSRTRAVVTVVPALITLIG